jgi:farnesyl-diphosphate farnesyltransferase
MAQAFSKLDDSQADYLDRYLNKVSRSFALVVPCLEEPLNHYLATAYLICRVADNIEDCRQPAAHKETHFREFEQLLHQPGLGHEILAVWEQESWPGLTPDESQLMGLSHGLTLWQIYAQMPGAARASITRWTMTMTRGMSRLETPEKAPRRVHRNGVQLLATESDYDLYCYFVAGTVGHLATELAIDHYDLDATVAQPLIDRSEACGRGLQKTNIVKDFAQDLARGISYLPEEWMAEVNYSPLSLAGAPAAWKRQVIDNVLHELEDAVEYLRYLPYRATGFRLAGLLCLLPAYQTMLLAAQRHPALFTVDHPFKISREVMAQCVQDTHALVADNEAIRQYGQGLRETIEAEFRP